MRIDLARRILETVVPSRIQLPPQTMSLDEVIGIAKTDAPPPTDEDCKKILEEERMKNTDDYRITSKTRLTYKVNLHGGL